MEHLRLFAHLRPTWTVPGVFVLVCVSANTRVRPRFTGGILMIVTIVLAIIPSTQESRQLLSVLSAPFGRALLGS